MVLRNVPIRFGTKSDGKRPASETVEPDPKRGGGATKITGSGGGASCSES